MRIVRKGINPVKLPFALKTNHPILASWANEVRTSIQQLRDRIPTVGGGFSGGGGTSGHPFKLRVSGGSLTVDYGMIYVSTVDNDSSTKPFLSFTPADIDIGTGELRNNPAGGTAGTLALSDSTTYGVWIELSWSFPGDFDTSAGFSGDFVEWELATFSVAGEIIVSSTHNTIGSTSSIQNANALKSYIWVGRVAVDGDGVATITQHLRSDLITPGISLPTRIISTDAPNEIYIGTDGGLIVDP
jgi:hypothetical protein